MTLVQAGTLLTGASLYYWLFSLIEIVATVAIIVIAIRWKADTDRSISADSDK